MGDDALSVVQAQVGLYKVELLPDPITHTFNFTLDKYALKAIQSLPPTYDQTTKPVFELFFAKYGTSFITTAVLGGYLEQRTSWGSPLSTMGFDPDKLISQAQIDFTASTGLGGWVGSLDPTYQNNRQVNPPTCAGGDPSSCQNATKWERSIAIDPTLLAYDTYPLSALMTDPSLQSLLEQAASAYLAEKQAEWDNLNKCPPTCHGGSCQPGAQVCDCTKGGVNTAIGRMCSQCLPGWDTSYDGVSCNPTVTSMTDPPNTIGPALFCGITSTQTGHNTNIGNHYQTLSVDGGTWIYNGAGDDSGNGAVGCLAKGVEGFTAAKLTVYPTTGNGPVEMGQHDLCLLTQVQTGWGSTVGNTAVSLNYNPADASWSWSCEGHGQDHGSVTCLDAPWLSNRTITYYPSQGVLGKHLLCGLAQIQNGHNSHIGNQKVYLSLQSGVWTLGGTGDVPYTAHAACIG
jgi:hypothetical protein